MPSSLHSKKALKYGDDVNDLWKAATYEKAGELGCEAAHWVLSN